MIETVVIAAVVAVLLAIDWLYRGRVARALAVALALLLWWYSLPNYTVAGRRASATPPEKRASQLRGDSLSQYMSGVVTMREAMVAQQEAALPYGLVGIGVLAWLACVPLVRRERASDESRLHS